MVPHRHKGPVANAVELGFFISFNAKELVSNAQRRDAMPQSPRRVAQRQPGPVHGAAAAGWFSSFPSVQHNKLVQGVEIDITAESIGIGEEIFFDNLPAGP